jgi:hypothetical protein
MDNRTCSVCGTEYPLDKQHFRWKTKDGKGHFTAECLSCRAKARRASAERKQAKREASLRQIEAAGVDLFLQSSAKGGSNIPHSAEVIERVFQYFGGVAGFSAVMVKQYWDSPPGGSARNRLLETLCRLVSKNVEQGGAKKPLSLWSEEELEQELNNRFQEALASFKGTTINVKAEEPRRLTAETPASAPEGLPACDPADAIPDAVPAGRPQGHSKRTPRKANRSAKAVPPEPAAGGDPQVQGQ